MKGYYKKTYKLLLSMEKNYFLRILLNVFIFFFILFITYDFNYEQHDKIQYITEISDNNENVYYPSFYQFDMHKVFENIENDISNKKFKKDDFKYNYHTFALKEEKKSLPFHNIVLDDTFLFTENDNYIIKDEYDILSMSDIKAINNSFYYNLEKILETSYKRYSTYPYGRHFENENENGDESTTYNKQELNFYNQYDGLHYSIFTEKDKKIEIQFYTDKDRNFDSLQKIIILEPNRIYFENNKSFAYNKIKYNKNVDNINSNINKNLYYYLLNISLYIFTFLFIINILPFIVKKIIFLYQRNKTNNYNSLYKKNSLEVIFNFFLFVGFFSLLYFIFIFYNQLNSINSFNNKKFNDYLIDTYEITTKKEILSFINQIDNIKNNKENMLINNDYNSILKFIDNNSYSQGDFGILHLPYFYPTESSFLLFKNDNSFFVKNKNNKVLLAQFNQTELNNFNEIKNLTQGFFTIDNKFYYISLRNDNFIKIEVFYDYYIYDGYISFDKKESYRIIDGIVHYYNTDISEDNNIYFFSPKKDNDEAFNNLFVSFIFITLILSYRRKYLFQQNKKNVIEIINVDNKITIEKTN